MTKSARHNISILMALILILSPLNSMYADQEHDCEQSEMIAEQVHEHENDFADHHHEASSQANEGSDCISCLGQSCCCNSGSCSCVMVISVYIQAISDFDFSYHFNSSSIPFSFVHHVQPDAHPLLRPPIA